MIRKAVSGISLALLLTSMLTLAFNIQPVEAEPRTWIVDDDGPADFPIIQDAINAASSGDTIFVHDGTYYEHVTISKSVSLVGEDRNTSIIDGSRNGTVVSVIADYVSVSRLTIRNGYHIPHITYGIKIGEPKHGCKNVAVYDNILAANDMGIFVYYSNNVTVLNNILFSNYRGLQMTLSDDNHIEGNSLVNNEWGIGVGSGANSNVIIDNDISNNDFGVCVGWSMDNDIVGNTISLSTIAGIRFDSSNSNRITGNTITSSSRDGIVLFGSDSNTIIHNELIQNNWDGIGVWYSTANLIYHNNFQTNTRHAGSYSGSTNSWDDGYPSGGNYWSDYTGSDEYGGPYQDIPGSDGIGDIPYVIAADNQDRYPLMNPWTPTPPTPTEVLEELIENIEAWDLHKGTENSLTSKLEETLHALDRGNENGASYKLMAFINHVEALRNKKLTEEQADSLISDAQIIIDLINEQTP